MCVCLFPTFNIFIYSVVKREFFKFLFIFNVPVIPRCNRPDGES